MVQTFTFVYSCSGDPPPVWTGYLSNQGLAIARAKASCDPRGVVGIEFYHQDRLLAIFVKIMDLDIF